MRSWKKHPRFSKLADIFNTAQTAQSAQTQHKYKIVFWVLEINIFGFAVPQAIKGYLKTTAQGKENAKEVNGPRISLRKQ